MGGRGLEFMLGAALLLSAASCANKARVEEVLVNPRDYQGMDMVQISGQDPYVSQKAKKNGALLYIHQNPFDSQAINTALANEVSKIGIYNSIWWGLQQEHLKIYSDSGFGRLLEQGKHVEDPEFLELAKSKTNQDAKVEIGMRALEEGISNPEAAIRSYLVTLKEGI